MDTGPIVVQLRSEYGKVACVEALRRAEIAKRAGRHDEASNLIAAAVMLALPATR